MYQFYALAIAVNIVGGFILAFDYFAEKFKMEHFFNRDGMSSPNVRMIAGGVTLIVGAIKLFTVTEGNWVFLGDFFPALAAMVTGFTLLLERFHGALVQRAQSERGNLVLSRLDSVFLRPRNVYGVVSIIAAVVHFLFHTVQFL